MEFLGSCLCLCLFLFLFLFRFASTDFKCGCCSCEASHAHTDRESHIAHTHTHTHTWLLLSELQVFCASIWHLFAAPAKLVSRRRSLGRSRRRSRSHSILLLATDLTMGHGQRLRGVCRGCGGGGTMALPSSIWVNFCSVPPQRNESNETERSA